MKHGDKKQKTAKAVSKASAKKSIPKTAGKASSKISSKASSKASAEKGKKPPEKAGTAKAGTAKAGSGGGGKSAPLPTAAAHKAGTDPVVFSNPVVAAAFRRAIKKFPVAFKRLVD